MLLIDIIKIQYIKDGYLPDYPPHLISISEMCDAFLQLTETQNAIIQDLLDSTDVTIPEDLWDDTLSCVFFDMYPCPGTFMVQEYTQLVVAVYRYIQKFKKSDDEHPELPDWVYSYMITSVVGPMSSYRDVDDLLKSIGQSDADTFNDTSYTLIYDISTQWLKHANLESDEQRPPTMFGEPHVLKSLRLSEVVGG